MKKISILLVILTLLCSAVLLNACENDVAVVVKVNFPAETVGYTLEGEAETKTGEPYEFSIAINEGYQAGENFAVKVNGEKATVANGKVTVVEVKNDLTITVEGVEQIMYNVTLATGAGFALTGETSVAWGADYTFNFAISEGYQAGENFAVKVNGEAVELTDGAYTATAVKGDMTVTVEGVEQIMYNVTLATGEGFALTGESAVAWGANYTFNFAFAEGYEAGEGFAVKVNGEAVELTDGAYTVTAVKGDIAVTVENVVIETLQATLETGEGYTLTGAESVVYGNDYTFNFAISEGYKAGENFAVKVNGEAVELTDGAYTVTAVKNDIDVTVEGIERIVYTVSLATGEGFTLTGAESVNHGDSYEITLVIAEGYEEGDDFMVMVNGKEVEVVNGKIIIEKVTENMVVTVEGIVLSEETILGDDEIENEDQWWKN